MRRPVSGHSCLKLNDYSKKIEVEFIKDCALRVRRSRCSGMVVLVLVLMFWSTKIGCFLERSIPLD